MLRHVAVAQFFICWIQCYCWWTSWKSGLFPVFYFMNKDAMKIIVQTFKILGSLCIFCFSLETERKSKYSKSVIKFYYVPLVWASFFFILGSYFNCTGNFLVFSLTISSPAFFSIYF